VVFGGWFNFPHGFTERYYNGPLLRERRWEWCSWRARGDLLSSLVLQHLWEGPAAVMCRRGRAAGCPEPSRDVARVVGARWRGGRPASGPSFHLPKDLEGAASLLAALALCRSPLGGTW